VTIKTIHGGEFRKRVEFAPGSPQNPLKEGALEEKFLDCLTYAAKPISRQRAQQLIDNIMNLEKQETVESIIP
jgi:hypothetical protein